MRQDFPNAAVVSYGSQDFLIDRRAVNDSVRHELLQDLIRSSGEGRVRATGASMAPAIWPGDDLVIQRICGPLSLGDVVAFLRDGRLFIHRITRASAGATTITTQGDRLFVPDPPVSLDALIGLVTRVERAGRPVPLKHNRGFSARLLRWASRFSDKPLFLLMRLRGVQGDRKAVS